LDDFKELYNITEPKYMWEIELKIQERIAKVMAQRNDDPGIEE
jgi:hypothetical protein